MLDALAGSDVIVCGHSYGGAVISEGAAGHANVRHLVYLAALMPDAGESCSTAIPAPPDGAPRAGSELAPAMQFSADGATITIDPELGRGIFYADCVDGDVDWAMARLGPHPAIALQQPVSVAAWRTVPSTYVVCDDDRAIAPWIQRVFANAGEPHRRVAHEPLTVPLAARSRGGPARRARDRMSELA